MTHFQGQSRGLSRNRNQNLGQSQGQGQSQGVRADDIGGIGLSTQGLDRETDQENLKQNANCPSW